MVERAVTGRDLYAVTLEYVPEITVDGEQLPPAATWDELSWSDQDVWEAKADELNESRRGTP